MAGNPIHDLHVNYIAYIFLQTSLPLEKLLFTEMLGERLFFRTTKRFLREVLLQYHSVQNYYRGVLLRKCIYLPITDADCFLSLTVVRYKTIL